MENTSKAHKTIPRRDRAFYRRRQQNRVHAALAAFFVEEAQAGRMTKKKLAELIEKDPAQITRWLTEPGNLEIDTISDILLAMGAEMDHRVVRFSDRPDAERINISVILFQEDEWWTAQCLEYDVAAQARTLPELRCELERVLTSHVLVSMKKGQPPFGGLKPAPQKFWDMFAAAKLRVEGDELPFRLPQVAAFPPIVPHLRIAETQTEYA